jgi:hypothetical protein
MTSWMRCVSRKSRVFHRAERRRARYAVRADETAIVIDGVDPSP